MVIDDDSDLLPLPVSFIARFVPATKSESSGASKPDLQTGTSPEAKTTDCKNKNAPALSERRPSPADDALNIEMIEMMRTHGGYVDDDANRIRERALRSVHTLVYSWVARFRNSPEMYPNVRDEQDTCQTRCRIMSFGSYRLGVYSSESDIDVLCIVPFSITRQDFFSEVYGIPWLLRQQPNITDVISLSNTYTHNRMLVSIIKFKCDNVQFDVLMSRLPSEFISQDLSDYNLLQIQNHWQGCDDEDIISLNGPRTALEILRRVPHVENFRTLLRCIKMWARRRGIYSSIVGFPGGVAWAIMCAKIVQSYPLNFNAIMLLQSFFDFYNNWDFNDAVTIAPFVEERNSATFSSARLSHADNCRPVRIITPTYPAANSTFNMSHSSLAVLKNEIKRACMIIQSICSGGKMQEIDTLSQLFEQDFFSLYENYVQVEMATFGKELIKCQSGYHMSKLRKLVEKLEMDEVIFPFSKMSLQIFASAQHNSDMANIRR